MIAKRAGHLLAKFWIPLVLVVVLSLSAVVLVRLHKLFASEDLNANRGNNVEIVQINPKVVIYDVYGPPGTNALISYFDENAKVHVVNTALPWSTTITTTLPAVSANLMAQGDTDQIGCKVTVNGEMREQRTAEGVNAQTFCVVKSA